MLSRLCKGTKTNEQKKYDSEKNLHIYIIVSIDQELKSLRELVKKQQTMLSSISKHISNKR